MLIAVGTLALLVGIVAERNVPIGYQTAGTPIYRPDAKINQDTAEISKFVADKYRLDRVGDARISKLSIRCRHRYSAHVR